MLCTVHKLVIKCRPNINPRCLLYNNTGVQLNIVGDPIITEANVVVTVCVNLFGGLGSEPASVTLRSRDDTAKGMF